IGVAIVRNAHIRAAYLDNALDLLRMNAAATVIDVHAIRLVMRHGDVSAQLAQDARRGFVRSAVRDIDSDTHFLERHSLWKTCFGEFHVPPERVIDSRRAPDFVRSGPDGIDLAAENELLNFLLDLIVQLVAVVPKKF